MLQFLCPNGHKIHCPDDQAGRAAKCPKCGVAFKVPLADQTGPDKQATAEATSGVTKAAGEGSGKGPAKKEPQIEFLCPNGHRLHGPASMQGHAGQCPECGSKFRIPNYDDTSDEEEPETRLEEPLEDEVVDDSVDVMQDEPTPKTSSEDTAVAALPHPVAIVNKPSQSLPEPSVEEDAAAITTTGKHAWRELFQELWRHKGTGVVVEVLLEDGETVVPERFAADAAGQHALFAVKNSNGTYTITAVSWSAVARVMVRGLKNLPGKLFGE